MVLKPQDVLVLLKLVSLGSRDASFAVLAESVGMSPSEVHAGVRRAQQSRLYSEATRQPVGKNLEEFLVHGVKYAFPGEAGGKTRGVPTSYAAPPLNEIVMPEDDPLPPVWPSASGTVSGLTFQPLYKSAPFAAQGDPKLYELLALVDALRSGRVREQKAAIRMLKDRIRTNGRPS